MDKIFKESKGNVIIDVGRAFTDSEFESLFNESKYKVLYIGESYFIKEIQSKVQSNNVEYWSYEQLYSYSDRQLSSDEKIGLTDLISYVQNDKMTVELYDRTRSGYLFNYSTRNDVEIIKMTISAFRYVLQYHPSFMLLYECSHNIRSWIVAKVCEYMSIPVRYCRNHVFTWRNVLLEGMNRHPKLLGDDTVNTQPTEWENQMFFEIESRYAKGSDAIKPEYYEVMKERKMKKLYSFWKDFRSDWKHPQKVIYKNICYRAYEKLCTNDIPEKFIVFFLHLQPERTTLPEGYGFTQQYKAISLLNELIPEGWKIVVKEHPATFYRYCTPMGRWPGFYQALAALDKVVLVPLETDTYTLMGQSKAVSTISGTVNREGLMMGKPVIMFGLDFYFGEKPEGIYFYKDDSSLKAFINNIDDIEPEKVKQSFHDYILKTMMNTGTIGIVEGDVWANSNECIMNSNRVSRLKLLKYVLGN